MGQAIAASDGELLEASRRGERAAFGALVERYQEVVCAVTYSRTRDQALSEDVAQDTFVAAWRQLDQLREPGRLRAWLCGIARNLAVKARRRGDREQATDDPIGVSGDSPFEAVCAAEAERIVASALSRVPELYRDVLVLYYREQWSAREIGDALGLTEAAVGQRLARGRQYLASGVNVLVETSLRGRHVQSNLRTRVLLALPPIAGSQVETTPSSSGGTMWKLAIAVAVFGAAGITVFVTRSEPEPPRPASMVAAPAPHAQPAAIKSPTLPKPSHPRYLDLFNPFRVQEAPPTPDFVDPIKIQQLGLDRGPSRGSDDAPVTIIMFTDMKCPFCARSQGTLDQLLDEYPNKVRVVVKQFPVHRSPDKRADVLAEALYAAEAQGKFWELHDLMRANQDELTLAMLPGLAAQAGLDAAKLQAALDQHTYKASVDADLDAGKAVDVRATPAFLVNGQFISGAQPIDVFRKAIEDALSGRLGPPV
jgi:RNA polymerase sigma factor (sigma-70 family)